jgi:hypothetical protein
MHRPAKTRNLVEPMHVNRPPQVGAVGQYVVAHVRVGCLGHMSAWGGLAVHGVGVGWGKESETVISYPATQKSPGLV